jgi:hypothetical protein
MVLGSAFPEPKMARKNVSANQNERSGSVKMAMDGGE